MKYIKNICNYLHKMFNFSVTKGRTRQVAGFEGRIGTRQAADWGGRGGREAGNATASPTPTFPF